MKAKHICNILIINIYCLISPTVVAQEHVAFNHTLLKGTLVDFCQELQQQGFQYAETRYPEKSDPKTMAFMNGYFNEEPCYLMIFATKQTFTVWKVYAVLPKINGSQRDLEREYQHLKAMFSQLYGCGYACEDSSNCMTYWRFLKGSVLLEINREGRIAISFEDGLNTVLKRQEMN